MLIASSVATRGGWLIQDDYGEWDSAQMTSTIFNEIGFAMGRVATTKVFTNTETYGCPQPLQSGNRK